MDAPIAFMAALVIIMFVVLSRIQNAAASHAGAIAGSIAGAVVLVVIIVLMYRKCHQKVKESKDTGVELISTKFSGEEENEKDYRCTVDYKNPLYTNNYIAPPADTTSSNDMVANKSCDSAAVSNATKPSNWTSDAYDVISDYKRPCFDSTYDHLPTNVKEESVETYVTMDTKCGANQTYEDMASGSTGVDDKTNVAS